MIQIIYSFKCSADDTMDIIVYFNVLIIKSTLFKCFMALIEILTDIISINNNNLLRVRKLLLFND